MTNVSRGWIWTCGNAFSTHSLPTMVTWAPESNNICTGTPSVAHETIHCLPISCAMCCFFGVLFCLFGASVLIQLTCTWGILLVLVTDCPFPATPSHFLASHSSNSPQLCVLPVHTWSSENNLYFPDSHTRGNDPWCPHLASCGVWLEFSKSHEGFGTFSLNV